MRLKKARLAAGYETATAAAEAMGVKVPTYIHHENGRSGLSRVLKRYAAFFRVSADWLLTGRGDMKGRASTIPVMGRIAGGAVQMADEVGDAELSDSIELPGNGRVAALQVDGDSEYPRFCAGEFVLYDLDPVMPAQLVGRYAVVQTHDGRRQVKILQQGRRPGVWRLESHKSPPQDDVELIGVWRYLGVIPGP
ncbi:XRE family transcriptional regulator [Methylocapsa aurea]|uniref:XRE family transcriptional regulator n=1 Tax=Methylocapsa aurea TaxID=663610 RepID=UPI003D18C56F